MTQNLAVAISTKDSNLGNVEIETLVGDLYRFPAMDKQALRTVVKEGSDVPTYPTLTLANISFSVLSVPFPIIKQIIVDGEVWFKRA